MIPRLHIITNDDVVTRADFIRIAAELLVVLQRRAALHVRAQRVPAALLFRIAVELAEKASRVGSLLLLNERVDVALAAGAQGVQLNKRALPVATVRRLLPPTTRIGYSAHDAREAEQAAADGADFIVAGSIYQTSSHPGAPAAGLELLSRCAEACSVPVIAIGGLTAERIREVSRTGAYGIAVISAVWNAPDPVQAAEELATLVEE